MNALSAWAGTAAVGFALNLLIAGSLVAFSVALLRMLLRGSAPRVRYLAAVAGFAVAAMLPVAWTFHSTKTQPAGDAARPRVVTMASAAVAAQVTKAAERENGSAAAFTVVWAGVAVLLLAREIHGHAILARRRRTWQPAAREYREAIAWPDALPLYVAPADGPAVVGLLDPAVVLPERWLRSLPPDLAACVARHELDHARWRDPLVNAVLRAVRAVLWVSVPLWLLERIAKAEREMAADSAALAHAGADDLAAGYAGVLLDAAAVSRGGGMAFGSAAGLETRIDRLFEPRRLGAARAAFAAALVLGAAVAVLTAPRAHHRQPSPVVSDPAATHADAQATIAVNEILSTTSFRNHELSATVKRNLRRIEQTGSIQPLAAGLRSTDPRTRESVAWIAAHLGDRRLTPLLLPLLEDANPHVQHTAAWALGRRREM